VITCIRTVTVPAKVRARFLEWIRENRALRETHGLLFELILEPAAGGSETVVITAWPSHGIFDAWIATSERDALTASDVHKSVDYHPITRYDVVGGHVNVAGLSTQEDVR
jgi:heme-degrading monooxygenase HmoA